MFGVGHSEGPLDLAGWVLSWKKGSWESTAWENRPDLWPDSGTLEVTHEEEIWLSEYGAAESDNLQCTYK